MRRVVATILLSLGLTAGCRRREVAVPPASPTTRVTVTTATTGPATRATPQKVQAVFVINGQPFTFPAAKLVTRMKDDVCRVSLFSDDPPEAVREGYAGNSFYFTFDLPADSVDDVAGQQFAYRNSASVTDDTSSGLFIAGGRQTLRPVTAAVTFERSDDSLVVYVGGTFKLIDDQTADGQPPLVKVQAELLPMGLVATP